MPTSSQAPVSASAMEKFKDTFRCAKYVSTPLMIIRTADPSSTMHLIATDLFDPAEYDFPILSWDIADGFKVVRDSQEAAQTNQKGYKSLATAAPSPGPGLGNRPAAAMLKLRDIQQGTIVFFANAHRYLGDLDVIQALHNLRACFAEKNRTLVLLTIPGARIPAELTDHVFALDEPLPTREDLQQVVEETVAEARTQNEDMAPVSQRQMVQATDALLGLTVFSAQQTIAMSLTLQGLNLERVWERKVKIIEETPGLSVWKGGQTFDDIAGYDNAKRYLRLLVQRDDPPKAIVFFDEIEKHLAGHGGESSPVKTEMIGEFLTWAQDKGVEGVIFVGPSGTGKSEMAKAAGNSIDAPTIVFNFSATQAKHVGESGDRLRGCLQKIEAISQNKALFIATSNNIAGLPAELRRRFNKGILFFDLPDVDARAAIWDLYCRKYNLSGKRPSDTDWSGSDIKNCCLNALQMKIPLLEAAQFITAEGISAKDQLRALRQYASGRYLDASKPGLYQFDERATQLAPTRGRAMKLASAK
jgi:hypothetical protein